MKFQNYGNFFSYGYNHNATLIRISAWVQRKGLKQTSYRSSYAQYWELKYLTTGKGKFVRVLN
jgi:hypothetical protein